MVRVVAPERRLLEAVAIDEAGNEVFRDRVRFQAGRRARRRGEPRGPEPGGYTVVVRVPTIRAARAPAGPRNDAGLVMAERLMLGVGMDAYAALQKLARAVADVREVAERLAELGFATETCSTRRAVRSRAPRRRLPDRRLAARGTALVVLWAGHAETNPSGRLRLYAVDNAREDGDVP